MKASLSNYAQTPRKTRLVTDLVKGRKVTDALMVLSHLDKRAAAPIRKLILSAVANAKQQGKNEDALAISSITVNEGIVLRRIMPRARGSASPIRKRRSHVDLVLKETQGASPKKGESDIPETT